MPGADDDPQQMRHNDADKADHTADRDGDAGHCRNHHDGDFLQPLDIDTGVKGFGLAKHKHIEAACDQRDRQQCKQCDGRNHPGFRPCRTAERAEQPECDVAQLAIIGDENQKPDARIGDSRYGETGQQEDRNRGAAFAAGDLVKNRGCLLYTSDAADD